MRLDWDLDSERLYEIGTDRGVVYPFNEDTKEYETGYAWNGLTGIDESPSGAEQNAIYANNSKYANNRSKEEFSATITAYTYPEEFELLDGTAILTAGAKCGQQHRIPFGFAYRTKIGNDIEGDDYGYKIHLIYNCIASPSDSKNFETESNDPNAISFSWTLTTTPVEIEGEKRSAHIVVDSFEMGTTRLKMLEDILYGTENSDPRFPSVEELSLLYPELTLTGDIVTFQNGAPNTPLKALSVEMEPIQDLNGYDHPWAGGMGKNLLENIGAESITVNGITFTKSSDGTVTANGTATADAHNSISINLPAGDYLVSGCADDGSTGKYNVYVWDLTTQSRPTQWDGVTPSISIVDSTTMGQIKIESGHNYVYRIRVYSGYTANNILFRPMICVSTETDPTFEPYENICPISGHTAATVTRAGKNLAKPLSYTRTANNATGTFNGDDTITVSTEGAVSSRTYVPEPATGEANAFLIPAGSYTLSVNAMPNGVGLELKNAVTQGTVAVVNSSGGVLSASFTLTGSAKVYARVRFDIGATVSSTTINYQIEPGTTATAWETYNGDTYTVQFGDTIYGGTLDFTTGVLTATHKMIDLGDQTWGYTASAQQFYCIVPDVQTGGTVNPYVSDMYASASRSGAANVGDGQIGSGSSGGAVNTTLVIKDTRYSDTTAFAAAVTGHQAVYPLTTPQTIQLTPEEVRSIAGENNIWSDSGDVTVTCRVVELPENP